MLLLTCGLPAPARVLPLQIFDSVVIPLDVAHPGQLEFLLLELGHRTGAVDVVDAKREIGFQPSSRRGSPPHRLKIH